VPFLDQLNKKYDQELADALIMLSDRIATIHSTEAKSHALKGDILMSTNNPKGAAKAYEKTVSLNDNVFSVWEGLLEAYTEIGNTEKLKQTATNVLDLFPNKPSAYVYYGRAYTMVNEMDEAIDLLEEGLMVSGKDVTSKSNIHAELARAYLMKKEISEANDNITKSLELSKNQSSLALEIKGDICFVEGQPDKAIAHWKKAQKINAGSKRLEQKIVNKRI